MPTPVTPLRVGIVRWNLHIPFKLAENARLSELVMCVDQLVNQERKCRGECIHAFLNAQRFEPAFHLLHLGNTFDFQVTLSGARLAILRLEMIVGFEKYAIEARQDRRVALVSASFASALFEGGWSSGRTSIRGRRSF